MDSLPFSQSELGTQGEGPCFMVVNSQIEESQDNLVATKISNATIGPNKQRMLWELAALRGTQPSPVLTGGKTLKPAGEELGSEMSNSWTHLRQSKKYSGRTVAGSQPTEQQQGTGSHLAPTQGNNQHGNAGGSGNQGNQGQDAGGGASAGGGGGGDNGGGGGGGGGGGEDDEEEDHEETGEETSQGTSSSSSSNSSVPKLVEPPALRTPPRTVRVREIIGGATSNSPATSPELEGLVQSDDPGAGSEHGGGGVSDAPTAVVGDSTDEAQGAITSPSPPMERGEGEGEARGSGLMDPPLHAVVPKKRSSESSHSSTSSSSSSSKSTASLHASHDSASGSLHSSLSTTSSLSSGDGAQAAAMRFTQIKEHPVAPAVLLAQPYDAESLGEADGEQDSEQPQSTQPDLFLDVTEEKKVESHHEPRMLRDHPRVLANDTSTSDSVSTTVVSPSPEGYRNGIRETPPHRIDPTRPTVHQPGEVVLMNETSTSENGSVTIVPPSPEAYGTTMADTPPHKIAQYSRSTHSSVHEGPSRAPSTPSETIGSLHLSGQQAMSHSEGSSSSIVPPTPSAYESIPQLLPTTPTPPDEEEPMELSLREDDDDNVAMATPPKRPKSSGVVDDEYKIPDWQRELNQEQERVLSRSSRHTSSSSKTSSSSSSQQSSESFQRPSANLRGQQGESFQAWQPSSQQTPSTTSEEASRSRPPSEAVKTAESQSVRARGKGSVAERPRPVSASERRSAKQSDSPKQKAQSQPSTSRKVPELPAEVSVHQKERPQSPSDSEHRGAATTSRQERPKRLQRDATSSQSQASMPGAGEVVMSSISSEEKGPLADEKHGTRDSQWALHYTPTQTETEAEGCEEEAGKDQHEAISMTTSAAVGSREDAKAVHTLLSYADTTSSSSSKKASTESSKEGMTGIDAPSSDSTNMPAPNTTGAPMRRSTPDDHQQGIGPEPTAESHSIDTSEYSSIDFHMSLPTDGGFRPMGGVTLPSVASQQRKERALSSRQPIRHSTPIMEEASTQQNGREAAEEKHTDQEKTPKMTRSGTLTLGVDIEPDSQEGSELPAFQLERPSDTAELLKLAHESPSKRATSIFTKVQETKTSSFQSKGNTQKSTNGAVKYSESDDPFAVSLERPTRTSAERHMESVQSEIMQIEDEDEQTIPVHYQEEEKEKEVAIETADKTRTDDGSLNEEREKQGLRGDKREEKTPERKKRDKLKTATSKSRLTRSGRKRKAEAEQPKEGGKKAGAEAKKTRVEEGDRELRKRPSGHRDPYDFSDSQSNKTPSPIKKDSRKTDKTKNVSSPVGQQKTPPVAEVLQETTVAVTPAKTTPQRNKNLKTVKSTPVARTSSTRGKRAGTGRPRHQPSEQVLQAQQDESSPEFQPDQPREKTGVKFRKSPRKKATEVEGTSAAEQDSNVPPPPRRNLVKRTTVYRLVKEDFLLDGKLVKSRETWEQVESLSEPVKDDDSVDFPSPSHSGSSLTSGSLADISSMYSKTSSSSPSLGRSLSGETLSKHSSFSSIARSSSSASKNTLSPGSDKSTPGSHKSGESPGSAKSPLKSPRVEGPASPRRVSFARSLSMPATSTTTLSSSTDNSSKIVFQKPHQTSMRKVPARTDKETGKQEASTTRKGQISVAEAAESVQQSQEPVCAEERTRTDPEVSGREATTESSEAHRLGRRSSWSSSTEQGHDFAERSPMSRTRSSPAKAASPGVKPTSGSEEHVSIQRTRSKDYRLSTDNAADPGKKKTPHKSRTSEGSPSPSLRGDRQRREYVSSEEHLSKAPMSREASSRSRSKECTDPESTKRLKERQEESSSGSSNSRSSTHRSLKSRVRGTTKKPAPTPSTPPRAHTPPEQSAHPTTSDLSSFPRDTLLEPPSGETLPITEGETTLLVSGLKVYTKWLDGFWYPGTIHNQDKSSRYVIKFDDGDHRMVHERDIIIKEWLSRGQSVMGEDPDGFYYAGVVVGYYKDVETNTSGYVVEKTESHQTARYERQRVILTKDQAANLISSASSSSNTSGSNVISLDNIVYNRRTRLRSSAIDTPGRSKNHSPKHAQKTTPSRQGVKRKLVPSDGQQMKETPSPRKRGRKPKAATSSADRGASPRRSPRKHRQQQSEGQEPHPIAVHMGPLPKQATLFQNYAFLITHAERTASSEPSDESSGDNEEEVEAVPFDRSYAMQQIQTGGGIILSDFDKSQIIKMKVMLIANTYCRTKKYFQALAAGIPCISHLWLRDCCNLGTLENHRNYLLPAGKSLEEETLMEIQPNRSILAGMTVYMVSDYEGVQDTWRSILIAAGCRMVSRLPSHLEFTKDPNISLDCNVIVTDPSCPRSLLHRARNLSIPVVSCEWVIQCLINGVRVPYRGHYKYDWNYRDKPTTK